MYTILDDIDLRLGDSLRGERERRGWSVGKLARQSGVSRVVVDRIERGLASPTAAVLGQLSAAFGLRMSELLAKAEDRTRLATADHQGVWTDPDTGFSRRQLSPSGGTSRIELIEGHLPAGATIASSIAADGFLEQQIVVLEGALTVLEAEESYVLAVGDCLELDPPTDRRFRNHGRVPCRYMAALLMRHS